MMGRLSFRVLVVAAASCVVYVCLVVTIRRLWLSSQQHDRSGHVMSKPTADDILNEHCEIESAQRHRLRTSSVIAASVMNEYDDVTITRLMERSDTGIVDLGSTHKWLVTLDDGQLAVFKPDWYVSFCSLTAGQNFRWHRR